MHVFDQFHRLAGGNLTQLNTALVSLIPKKDGADKISDFRPISLIHSMAKLIAKVLSIRLAAVVQDIISPAQSAFLSSKGIHDSFLYVQNTVRSLHMKKTPALLLKLDIA
uniref:Uncharacterized protein n=1 Tax=Aegilops tauschii subsp. strangulata TaxID=200361 RepID=A0A453F5J4_AEGTS